MYQVSDSVMLPVYLGYTEADTRIHNKVRGVTGYPLLHYLNNLRKDLSYDRPELAQGLDALFDLECSKPLETRQIGFIPEDKRLPFAKMLKYRGLEHMVARAFDKSLSFLWTAYRIELQQEDTPPLEVNDTRKQLALLCKQIQPMMTEAGQHLPDRQFLDAVIDMLEKTSPKTVKLLP